METVLYVFGSVFAYAMVNPIYSIAVVIGLAIAGVVATSR